MTKVCIDTNIYVAFRRNDDRVVRALRRFELVGFDVVVIAELLAGFKMGSRETENAAALTEFLDAPRVTILAHDLRTAEFYGFIVNKLKEKGTPIPTNDIWIAANALNHGLALFSYDKHFELVDGLMLLG